ncbi:MAG TPA: hypothetical protein VLJ88_18230, partial [Propionibacteriaceae bacterium]|nr:hypothetical protein [Propionibacteriaceae bacterium]
MSSKRPSGPVPAPEPLPGPVVDNHTHLDHLPGTPHGTHPSDEQVAELIAAAVAVNVPQLV